jgi:hypothetical protein
MSITLGPASRLDLGTSEPFSHITHHPPSRSERARAAVGHAAKRGAHYAGKAALHAGRLTAKALYHSGRLAGKGLLYTAGTLAAMQAAGQATGLSPIVVRPRRDLF